MKFKMAVVSGHFFIIGKHAKMVRHSREARCTPFLREKLRGTLMM